MFAAFKLLQSSDLLVAAVSLVLGVVLAYVCQALGLSNSFKRKLDRAIAPTKGYANVSPCGALAPAESSETGQGKCSPKNPGLEDKPPHASASSVFLVLTGDVPAIDATQPHESEASADAITSSEGARFVGKGSLSSSQAAPQGGAVDSPGAGLPEDSIPSGEVQVTCEDTARPPDAVHDAAPSLSPVTGQVHPTSWAQFGSSSVSAFGDTCSAYDMGADAHSVFGRNQSVSYAGSFNGSITSGIAHDSVTSFVRHPESFSKDKMSKAGHKNKSKAAAMIKDAKNLLRKSFTLNSVKEEPPRVMISGKDGDKRASSVFRNNKISPTPVMYAMVHPKPAAPKDASVGSSGDVGTNKRPSASSLVNTQPPVQRTLHSKMPGLPNLQLEETSNCRAEMEDRLDSPPGQWNQQQGIRQPALPPRDYYGENDRRGSFGAGNTFMNMPTPFEQSTAAYNTPVVTNTFADMQLGNLSQLTDMQLGSLSQLTDMQLGSLSQLTDMQLGNLSQLNDMQLGNLSQLTDMQLGNLSQLTDMQLGNLAQGFDWSSLSAAQLEELLLLAGGTNFMTGDLGGLGHMFGGNLAGPDVDQSHAHFPTTRGYMPDLDVHSAEQSVHTLAGRSQILSRESSGSMESLLGQAAAAMADLVDSEDMSLEGDPRPGMGQRTRVAQGTGAPTNFVPETVHRPHALHLDEMKLQAINNVNWSSSTFAMPAAVPPHKARAVKPSQSFRAPSVPGEQKVISPRPVVGTPQVPEAKPLTPSTGGMPPRGASKPPKGSSTWSGKGHHHPDITHHAAAAAAAYAALQTDRDIFTPRLQSQRRANQGL